MYLWNRAILTLFFCTFFTINTSRAQGTNLLQQYIKRYFQDYTPTPVRSYTLYGNGQNGAADFNGGLPFPLDTRGKVQSLIYSTSSIPPAAAPKASLKSSDGTVGNSWLYPGSPNINPYQVPYPIQGIDIQQQQSRSDPEAIYSHNPSYQIPKSSQYFPHDPVAESRMAAIDPRMVNLYDNAEMQSTMMF